MPTTYSHMAFGERVLAHLTGDEQGSALCSEINKAKNDFMVGTHGPDLLFYYKALKPNDISRIGSKLHSAVAADLMEKLKEIALDSAEGFAYAMGVVCHYVLDYHCHPYVNHYRDEKNVSHGEIELEMDRKMMLTDGHDPMTYRPADSLSLSKRLWKPLEKIYVGATAEQIGKAAESFVFYCGLGVCPNNLLRNVILRTMKLIGLEELSKGHVMVPQANPVCDASSEKLCQMLEATVSIAVETIKAYNNYICGEGELPEIFFGTFGGPVSKTE